MANGTMEKIETVTVGSGGTASITFSNIPTTYDDLKIVLSARSNNASTVTPVAITFNANTTDANYTYNVLYGSNTTVGGEKNTASRFGVFYIDADSATTSIFGNAEIYIPNYRSSNAKSYSTDAVAETNATSYYMGLNASFWNQTSTITTVALTCGLGNFMQHSTATLYGITRIPAGAKATGGVITDDANFWYHTFTSSGTFTTSQNLSCDYLVVAGGGGGGLQHGGGGGAGGLRSTVGTTGGGGSLESALSLTANTNYTVTIGAGGAGTPAAGSNGGGTRAGNAGSNSVFSTITSTGGGGGGTWQFYTPSSGGSGGGGKSNSNLGGTGGGAGTANQGYGGGSGQENGQYGAGGGGGSGSIGANGNGGTGTTAGGNGGNGVSITALATPTNTGVSGSYAGGGGGGLYQSSSGGTKGLGQAGGGNGGRAFGADQVLDHATNATVNTGGGGGGQGTWKDQAAGNGGSGIVIIRYAK